MDYSLPESIAEVKNLESQNAALGVLTQLVQLYTERVKEKENKRKHTDDEDEETTVQQTSDDEGAEGESANDLVEILAQNVSRIVQSLEVQTASREQLETSYEVKIVPLGSLRLKLVELLYQIMKLGKEPVLKALGDSQFFSKISALIEAYPWNNFLHLKAIAVFEDLLESAALSGNKEFLKHALTSSNIGQTLITLGADSNKNFNYVSNRPIRHGYMAVVVKIANLLQKNKTKEEVAEYIDSLGEEWKNFVEGELKRSNDTNSKSLGGQQPRPQPGDDDDMEGSMSMDSILSRFSNFSSERNKREQQVNSQQDDDEEDEDEDEDEGHDDAHREPHEVEQNEDKLTFLRERDEVYHTDDKEPTVASTSKPVQP